MALQMNYEYNGIPLADAYFKVDTVEFSKQGGIVCNVHIYVSKSIADNGGSPIAGVAFALLEYDPNGGEPLTQAYTKLKQLDEFTGAIDV